MIGPIYKQSQAHPALPAGKQPIPGEDNFPPVRKLTHSSRGGSAPGSRDAKGRGLGRDFGGKFGAKAAWQEPGMPAPCSLAAEEQPPPNSASPALHAAGHTRRGSPRLPKAVEDRREAAWPAEVGVIYFDGKKVKLDQPARHPAGSGGEEPKRNTQKWPQPLPSQRHGHAWSVALGAVTVSHKHRVASGV